MKVPKPKYKDPLYMETDVNIDGQLAMLNQQAADFNSTVSGNVGNSAVGNALRLANMQNQTAQTVGLVSNKQQAEKAARNQLRQSNNQIDSTNKALEDAYNMERFKKDIRTEYTNPSQNLANIESNIKDKRSEDNLKDYQEQSLAIMKAGHDNPVAGAVNAAQVNSSNGKNYADAILDEPTFKATIQNINKDDAGYSHMVARAKTLKTTGTYTLKDGTIITFINGDVK